VDRHSVRQGIGARRFDKIDGNLRVDRVTTGRQRVFEPHSNTYRPLRHACGHDGLQCVTDAR